MSYQTIDEYIALQPEEYRELLQQVREVMGEAAPLAKEAIKYQMPTFVQGENLIHFGWAKNHLGVYPTPAGIEKFADRFEREGYKYSKGAVQFPWDRAIPFDLIREMTLFRVEMVTAKGLKW